MKGSSPLVDEALRVNARYVEEVVIGWNLCPWAAQAWREGAVARRVLVEPSPDTSAVLAFLDEIAPDARTSIGLVICPRLAVDEAAWGTFAERVRRADRARRQPGAAAPFLLAAFHPLAGGPDSPPADTLGPSLFTVLQQQLGLKLETKKVRVDMVVVDKAEKPSEN